MSFAAAILTVEAAVLAVYLILRRWKRMLLYRAWHEQAEEIVKLMTTGQRFVVMVPPRGMSLEEAQAVVDAVYERVRPGEMLN